MYSTYYSCQIRMNLCFLDRFLKNIWISHFIKVQWKPRSFTQTDRDMTKLVIAFANLRMHLQICCIAYFHTEQHQWYRHWYSALLNELVSRVLHCHRIHPTSRYAIQCL